MTSAETVRKRKQSSEPSAHPELSFNIWLEATCRRRLSHLCVGLDPDLEQIKPVTDPRRTHNVETCVQAMILAAAAAAPYAAAFKPNAAFFEALEETLPLMAHMGVGLRENYPEVISICDAKRGDIGNTSARYAEAVFENQNFHSVTVNPLMGYDAVEPFLRNPARGAFLLCLTSNPGADDFLLKNELYLRIAEKAVSWNSNNNVGLVVGATRPEYLEKIRQIAPDLPLLIPGIGAQGGQLAETLDAIGARSNRAFLINASRSLIYPEGATSDNYSERVAAAAQKLKDEINSCLI